MSKILDLRKTVYELVKQYPEVTPIMSDLGFSEITKKIMLNSVGKLMTIPKGAKMKNIPMDKIIKSFSNKGFEVIGVEDNQKSCKNNGSEADNISLIKSYLKRLNEGEDMESVRKDFVENFSDVAPESIMKAEQELIKEGTPINEVQNLCDIHSALFHDSTINENNISTESDKLKSILATPGHLLYTLNKENEKLIDLIKEVRVKIESKQEIGLQEMKLLKSFNNHYKKKGDLIFPLLKVNYDISGPSDVMWAVDMEINSSLSALLKNNNHNEEWTKHFTEVLNRMEEMVYKETNILFPMCAEHFSVEEWKTLYKDSKDYENCLSVEMEIWSEGEKTEQNQVQNVDNQTLNLPGGHFIIEQLTAVLNTIPLEITFVDENNINSFFNEGEKVFKRPSSALGREVFSCHPPKIETMVRHIIDSFRSGKQDKLPFWMEKEGKTFLVTYMAVRDKNKKYLGTMELVQDMSEIINHLKTHKTN